MCNNGLGERPLQRAVVARISPANDLALALLGVLVLLCLVVIEATGLSGALPAPLRLALRIPRLLLGFAYVLYVPGYWLTAALFPGNGDLDGIGRLGLSVGLSIAWVSVLALVLDRLPWGLRLWPILVGEGTSTLLFAVAALVCRARIPVEEAYAPRPGWPRGIQWHSLTRLEKYAVSLCAGAPLVAVLAAAWIFLGPSRGQFMTEFYLLGPEGLAENYPRETAPGEIQSLTFGIANGEQEAAVYVVQVWAVDPWSGREEKVGGVGPLMVPRNHSLRRPVTWHVPWAGPDQKVEFRLFRQGRNDSKDSKEPYRLLQLWLDVHE